MKAVILAAGKGTRFGDITKTTPKSLIPVNGKPIIEYTLSALPPSVTEVYLVIGHLGDKIKKHIGKTCRGLKINYVTTKKLNGTGGALIAAKKFIKKERFLVLYGDDIYSKNELEKMLAQKRSFGLAKIPPPSNKYLAIQINKKDDITGARYPNKKEMRGKILVFTGALVLDDTIFRLRMMQLSNGEYGLPQTILKNIKKYPIKGMVMKHWIQINDPKSLAVAEKKITR